jgi:alanyl aminopeptidase
MEAQDILFGATSIGTRAAFWDSFKANYDPIVAKLPREAGGFIPYFWRGFCDADHRQDVEAFFKARVEKLPGAPRALAQTLETIDLCIAARAVQEPRVRRFLETY